MFSKYLIVAAAAVTLATSALAQTVTEYYVVQDVTTKKCMIVDKKANNDHSGSGWSACLQNPH